jgi:hypothetical protein
MYSFVLLWQELGSNISEVGSPARDLEFPGDDVTDDDIGSIMEQLSQLAGSAGKYFQFFICVFGCLQFSACLRYTAQDEES